MITYPTNEIRSLDELQKWITDKTKFNQVTVSDEYGKTRVENTTVPLEHLRAFIREDILRDYLIHHKTLTINNRICYIDIGPTALPSVYKVSFDYVSINND
jgi:hypothetical protein